MNSFKCFVNNSVIVSDNKIAKRGNIYSITYGAQKDVKNILRLLYSDNIVSLNRKYKLANMACEEIL